MATAIKIDSISKNYNTQAVLQNISCDISEGAFVGIVGHNGAGKTTLMKIILGLITPDSGAVSFPTKGRQKSGVQMGYLPENIHFTQNLSGYELLDFYARLKKAPRGEIWTLLDRVELQDASHKKVKNYSKGMRQRLALALALLGAPKILILDEPTNGFDPDLRTKFYRILTELQQESVTILLCTHLLSELQHYADHLFIMKQGKLMIYDQVEALSRQINLSDRICVQLHKKEHDFLLPIAKKYSAEIPQSIGPDNVICLSVPHEQKFSLLQDLLAKGQKYIVNIHVYPPSFEEIYNHYGR